MLFQRAPKRKQLHQIDTNSPYFTSHSKSPIEVGFGEGNIAANNNGAGTSYYQSPSKPVRRRGASGGSADGGGIGCGFYLVSIIVWTILVLACGYHWLESEKVPKLQMKIREQEVALANDIWSQKYTSLEAKLKQVTSQKEALEQQNQQEKDLQVKELQGQVKKLNRDLEREKKRAAKAAAAAAAAPTLQSNGNVDDLQKGIQAVSKRALVEKFGTGPHRVEVEVNFLEDGLDKNWYFVVELAPIDEMPHAVHTFLEQVSHKLYDNGGYSFYTNAVHVAQGGPRRNHLTAPEYNPEEAFQNSGYNNVLFPEYSPGFPHHKYTLGLSGRPGGPSIYINMIDNSKNHGPGGYASDGTGDVCFGKVTAGFDVIDRMHNASGKLKSGEWKDTNGGPIAVRSVKILQ